MSSNRLAGQRIREHRLNKGWTPEDLGARVGLSGMTVRRIERGIGRPTPRTMFLLAGELDQDVLDIWPLRGSRVAVR